jgi:uncharacterized protein DUF3112
MARIVTTIMRIAAIRFSTDVPLNIAAQVFTSAGVIIIFIVNLLFAQRMMRAAHPHFGWHSLLSWAFKALYTLIIVTIIMVITVVVQSFYTLSPNTHRIDRDIQLAGVTFFAFVAFLPIPLVILGLIVPRRSKLDKFGSGRWRTKVAILMASSVLVCFGATYRAGTAWLTPVPRTQPMPKVMGKGPFYVVNFTVEIIVLLMYAFLRVDRRFHVPDGARGPGSYGGAEPWNRKSLGADTTTTSGPRESFSPEKPRTPGPGDEEKSEEGHRYSLPRVYSEEETFDQDEYLDAQEAEKARRDLEAGESANGINSLRS